MPERAKLLSEAEIELLTIQLPREPDADGPLGRLFATARAYHRLRGLVEAIAAMQPRREWQVLRGESVRVTCGHCLRMIADCQAALSALDRGEAKQDQQTGGSER